MSYQRLLNAEKEPQNWLTYAGSYKSHRYSPLTQINRQNAGQLKLAWAYQMQRAGRRRDVADRRRRRDVSHRAANSTVTALDVRSGRTLWTYTPNIPPDVIVIGSPPVNRGVAILDDSVFVGTVHGHLIALDAKSGAVRWDTTVEDNKHGFYLTLAPLALDGKIIVGVSGAETGIRGFVDAYDAKTGKLVWRTYTVPAPGEPGSETWGKGDGWKTGGGSTWLTGSFDPELNLLYWATGNPAPDWNADNRPGDNLYTDSVLALDPATGKMKWHFQFTPEDVHDWDANETLVLFDAPINGRERKLIAQANRNGFYYVLDRATGEYLASSRSTRSRRGPMASTRRAGRFARRASRRASKARWCSRTSRARRTGSARATARRRSCSTRRRARWARSTTRARPCTSPAPRSPAAAAARSTATCASGAIRALEATTGKMKWEFPLLSPGWTSLLSTGGGLLFGGTEEGNFFALDAESGKPLWDIQLGGAVRGIPISYSVDGKQYVAIAAGVTLYVFTV